MMMRIFPNRSAYNRRIRKSRRGIIIATALTLAAFVLTIAALIKGTHVDENPHPVAVQTPIEK